MYYNKYKKNYKQINCLLPACNKSLPGLSPVLQTRLSGPDITDLFFRSQYLAKTNNKHVLQLAILRPAIYLGQIMSMKNQPLGCHVNMCIEMMYSHYIKKIRKYLHSVTINMTR